MKHISKTNQKAFTLIELLVVIAVLGVLAAGVLTAINPLKRINQANDASAKNNLGQLAQALQSYYTFKQVYPPDLASLVTNGELKVLPQGTFTYQSTGTAACTAPSSTCESSIYFSLRDFSGTNSVWCWRSQSQIVTSTLITGCTP